MEVSNMKVTFLTADNFDDINFLYDLISEEINPIIDSVLIEEKNNKYSQEIIEELSGYLNINVSPVHNAVGQADKIVVCYGVNDFEIYRDNKEEKCQTNYYPENSASLNAVMGD